LVGIDLIDSGGCVMPCESNNGPVIPQSNHRPPNRWTLAELAAELECPPDSVAARLDRLEVAGVLRVLPGPRLGETLGYELGPRAEALAQARLFARLSKADLLRLAEVARTLRFDAEEMIFLEGEDSAGIYVVEEGLVRLSTQVPDNARHRAAGREQILRLVGPRESFNEVPVFDGGSTPVTAVAVEASRVLLVPAQAIRDLLSKSPSFATAIIADLAGSLRHLLALVQDLSLRQVQARVAKVLLQSLDPIVGVGAGAGQRRHLTQHEIAEMAGTVREVAARALKELEQDGAIRVERGKVTILDRAKLDILL
jgi:CRP/FNR family transcriptional regulator